MRPSALLVILVGACTSPSYEFELRDEGRLCVASDPYSVTNPAPQEFASDRPIYARVSAYAGCATEIERSCTVVELYPGTLDVHALIEWNEGGPCTRELHYVEVDCKVPRVFVDTTFRYAGYTIEIPMPGTVEQTPCVGDLSPSAGR